METPLRVLHLVTKLVRCGGASRYVALLADHENRAGLQSAVAYGRPDDREEELSLPPGVEGFSIPALGRAISPAADLAASFAIRALLRRFRPQVVCTHGSKAGVLGRRTARRCRVPVVIHHVHGWSFHERMSPLARHAAIVLERNLAHRTDALLFDSARDLELGLALGIGSPGRCHVVRCGIELDRFPPATTESRAAARLELGLPPDAFVIGCISQLRPQKAPLDFVHVAARVLDELPGAHFVWVGDGPLRGEVEDLARELGVEERLHLPGGREEVGRLYPALDVFLLPSLWEGLPRTLAEAFSVGVPVVATSVRGTTEAVIEGETGLLAEPGDVDALARQVLRLHADPALAARLRETAMPRAREFSIETSMETLSRLYRALMP